MLGPEAVMGCLDGERMRIHVALASYAEAVVELEVVDAEGDIMDWSSRAVPAGGSSTVRLPRADAGAYYVFVNASVPQTFFTASLGADE